ncbi:EpsG family protein [Butyrivibrio sp. ob235]|uniref:EpsG family protein n=1 Tax=Butyrivibrio sp. ob235 TaxID=1761780 RepID=UPI0008C3BACE|nr:EpsG family protein [Butyrivibrio sp. ob235]SEK63779.1 EpsG family protein [Butyrivibrio sp. ob235]
MKGKYGLLLLRCHTRLGMLYVYSYLFIGLLGVLVYYLPSEIVVNGAYKKHSLKSIYIYYFIILFILGLIAGFRADTVGDDTHVYSDVFRRAVYGQSVKTISAHHLNMESGFIWLAKCVSKFTDSRVLFFFMVAFITNAGIIYFFHNNFDFPMLPIQTYIALQYLTTLNVMRQYLAISIVLVSFVLYEKKKYLKFCIVFWIAFMFHKSSFLLLPYLAISKAKNKRKIVLWFEAILITGGVLLLNKDNLYTVLKFVRYGRLIYSKYLRPSENGLGIIKYIYLIILLGGVLVFFIFPKDLDDKFYVFYFMSVFATIFAFLAQRYTIVSRVAESYLIFIDLLFAYIFCVLFKKVKGKQLAYLVVYIILLIPLIRYSYGYTYQVYDRFW